MSYTKEDYEREIEEYEKTGKPKYKKVDLPKWLKNEETIFDNDK